MYSTAWGPPKHKQSTSDTRPQSKWNGILCHTQVATSVSLYPQATWPREDLQKHTQALFSNLRCKVLCSHRDIGTARAAAPVGSKTIQSGLGLKPLATNPQHMSHQVGSRSHVQIVVVPCMSRHRPINQCREELEVSGFSETSSRDPQQQMAWAEDSTV